MPVWIKLAVGILVFVVVAVAGWLLFAERAMVFPAPSVPRDELARQARQLGATEVTLTTEDGEQLYGWRFGDGPRFALMFTGNGDAVGPHYAPRYELLVREGFAVLHLDYRGYPGSTGRPSEQGVIRDARAAWDEARKTHQPEDIVIFGTSLGGGVALGLVSQPDVEPGGLVLLSTFTSVVDVASAAFSPLARLVMTQRFDSLSRATSVTCPTVVAHGDADPIVPFSQGRRLAEHIEGARFVAVPGAGHNVDLLLDPRVMEAVRETLGVAARGP